MTVQAQPVVFVPALLCAEAMYRDVIAELGSAVDARVLVSPKSTLEAIAASAP